MEKTGNFTMLKSDFGVTLKWKRSRFYLLTVENDDNFKDIQGLCKKGRSMSQRWISDGR